MQNPAVVCGAQGPPNLADDVCSPLEIHSFVTYHRPQTEAIDVLHYDVRATVGQLTDIEYANDARMIDSSQRFNLPPKCFDIPFVSNFTATQGFDDHRSGHHFFVRRKVDHPKAAAPEPSLD